MLQNLADNGIDLKKLGLYFLLFLFVIFIIVFLIINSGSKDYLIIKENLILTKRFSKWKQVKRVDDKLLEKKYSVIDEKKYDKVTLKYNKDYDSWYYLDDSYKDLNLTKVRVAYTKMFKGAKPADYSYSLYDDSDNSIVREALNNKDISKFQNRISKYSFDLDNDGTLDTIYTLTNESLAVTDDNEEKYSAIFLAANGKFVNFLDDDHSKPYRLIDIVDIDNDGKYEVIVNKGDLDLSYFDSCYQIYKINGNKISRIMDCK